MTWRVHSSTVYMKLVKTVPEISNHLRPSRAPPPIRPSHSLPAPLVTSAAHARRAVWALPSLRRAGPVSASYDPEWQRVPQEAGSAGGCEAWAPLITS